MPSGNDGTTVVFLKRELEASMIKIDSLENENHELKEELNRLKTQLNTLKAHDLERKSMLWKKLQNSMDCGKVIDEQPQKPKIQVDEQFKKHIETTNVNNNLPKPPPSPPQWLQRRVAAPPPPPPLPSSPIGSKAVRRVPAVMEFYRSLMKKDTHKENKNSAIGIVPIMNSRDMIGEIENRSTYLTSVS